MPLREWVVYLLATPTIAFGTALMEAADFGMSMVTAPAYLLYLKLSETMPFLTFGTVSYLYEALLLVIMALLVRKFRVWYLLGFLTAVYFGVALDGWVWLVGLVPCETAAMRLVFYVAGMVICALGVSLVFHTVLPPEIYEMFVKEISQAYQLDINRCKLCYDCISLLLAVAMSFAFFGFGVFRGVKLGTLVCALVNGPIIGLWSRLLESGGLVAKRSGAA